MWDAHDRVPNNLIPETTPEELETLGKFQLRRISYKVEKSNPEQLAKDIDVLIEAYPFTRISVLLTTKRVVVTSLTGSLRRVNAFIKEAEGDPPRQTATATKDRETQPELRTRRDDVAAPERRQPRMPANLRSGSSSRRTILRDQSILSELSRSTVAQSLKLTDDQREEIARLSRGSRTSPRDLLEALRSASADEKKAIREEFMLQRNSSRANAGNKAVDVLTPAQRRQFAEHLIRNRTVAAVGYPLVVKEFGLTDEQARQLIELSNERTKAAREARGDLQSKALQDSSSRLAKALDKVTAQTEVRNWEQPPRIFSYLTDSKTQEQLSLTASQLEQFEQIAEKARPDYRAILKRISDVPKEERTAIRKNLQEQQQRTKDRANTSAFEMLTDSQKEALVANYVARCGPYTLKDETIATWLKVTTEQQERLSELFEDTTNRLQADTKTQMVKEFLMILTPEQREYFSRLERPNLRTSSAEKSDEGRTHSSPMTRDLGIRQWHQWTAGAGGTLNAIVQQPLVKALSVFPSSKSRKSMRLCANEDHGGAQAGRGNERRNE